LLAYLKVSGLILEFPGPHVEVSLAMTLNPVLPLMCPSVHECV